MKKKRSGIPSRFIFTFLAILCVVFLFVNFATDFSGGPLRTVANYVFVPMQKGLSVISGKISDSSEASKTKDALLEENEALRAEVDDLTTQLTNLRLRQSELDELQELYELDKQYDEYEKTGANVIAKGTSNWFNTFTIDKGTSDGVTVDMNVIAGSGLVGIVVSAGKDYAVVRSIIDDTSGVAGMILNTSDNCIVSGDLSLMTSDNEIAFSNLEDEKDKVKSGDAIVTSNISDKFLSGILIGYIDTIEPDANRITKSGTLTPVVDFKHLQHVLVILETKQTGE